MKYFRNNRYTVAVAVPEQQTVQLLESDEGKGDSLNDITNIKKFIIFHVIQSWFSIWKIYFIPLLTLHLGSFFFFDKGLWLSFHNPLFLQLSRNSTINDGMMMTRKKYFLIFSAFKIKSREIIIQKIQLSCDFLTPAMLE